jgi:hypothetical protein
MMLAGAVGYFLAQRREDELRGCLTVAFATITVLGMILSIIGLVQAAGS